MMVLVQALSSESGSDGSGIVRLALRCWQVTTQMGKALGAFWYQGNVDAIAGRCRLVRYLTYLGTSLVAESFR